MIPGFRFQKRRGGGHRAIKSLGFCDPSVSPCIFRRQSQKVAKLRVKLKLFAKTTNWQVKDITKSLFRFEVRNPTHLISA
jgi:hypothetical protein